MESLEQKRKFTAEKRGQVQRAPGDKTPRVDLIKFEVNDVSYDLDNFLYGVVASEPETKPLFEKLNFSAPQGKIVAVVGRSGSGRRTFMEMMASKIFPKEGAIFIPSHLRCILVTRELVLLKLSLWENLVFGNRDHNNPHRVEQILQHLNLKAVLHMCADDLEKRKKEYDTKVDAGEEENEEEEEEKVEKENHMDKLRESERAYIHLARAFVMNPEVIVAHRPFANFHSRENLEKIEETFRMHRDSRGLLMGGRPERRRPRSILFSSDNAKAIESTADIIWELPTKIGAACKQFENKPEVVSRMTIRGSMA
jgi:ABC-type multidrug transport system fused ATPase/permease subunit